MDEQTEQRRAEAEPLYDHDGREVGKFYGRRHAKGDAPAVIPRGHSVPRPFSRPGPKARRS